MCKAKEENRVEGWNNQLYWDEYTYYAICQNEWTFVLIIGTVRRRMRRRMRKEKEKLNCEDGFY